MGYAPITAPPQIFYDKTFIKGLKMDYTFPTTYTSNVMRVYTLEPTPEPTPYENHIRTPKNYLDLCNGILTVLLLTGSILMVLEIGKLFLR